MASWATTDAFNTRVDSLMRDFHVPGLSVAVLDGSNVYLRSFGRATIDGSKAIDESTIFDAASCSKALTGVAMGILVDSHPKLSSLGWKTPVADLIGDDFVMNLADDTSAITVEDLLSHTSGFSGHEISILGVNALHPDDVRRVTRNLRNLPSSSRPRERYQYSNIMYAVVTHIIEVLSEGTFSTFLHKNVFEPLGMKSTFLRPSEVYAAKLDSHFATPYFYEHDDYVQTVHQETPELQGAGSIQTMPSDYLKFIAAMLNHDKLPVTKSIYDEVTRPRVIRNGKSSLDDFGRGSKGVAYALGWDVKYYYNEQIITHDGVITGYGSRMFFLPGRSFGAVFMGNCDTAHGVSQMLQNEMIAELLHTPKEKRSDASPGRLQKQAAQAARKAKKSARNEQRRLQARDTLTVSKKNYCGIFHNAGYHEFTIQLQNADLFIDAADRSSPFNMTLEHVKDNCKFRGYITADDGIGEDEVSVEFRLDAQNNVVAVGFNWEPALGVKYLFWHDRISDI